MISSVRTNNHSFAEIYLQWSHSIGPYLYEQCKVLEVKFSAPVFMNIIKGKRFVYTEKVPLLWEHLSLNAERIMLDSITIELRGM